MPSKFQSQALPGLVGLAALAALTFSCYKLHINVPTTAFLFLCLILSVSLAGRFLSAAAVAIAAVLSLAYFFAEPIFDPRLRKSEDVGALIAFLATAAIVSRLVSHSRRQLEEISALKDETRLVIDTIPALVWSALPDGPHDFHNQRWLEHTGLSSEQALGWGWLSTLHPEHRDHLETLWQTAVATGQPFETELRLRRADGAYRWFFVRAVPRRDAAGNIVKWYGTSTDIEDRKNAEALLAGEKRLLEMVAKAEPLNSILDALCRLVEEHSDETLSSILLLDADGLHLRHGAAPSIPVDYVAAIDGAAIGPNAGSCGTAAYRAQTVIVSDIATDPLWADYRIALKYGLRACWSTPILSPKREVMGTFAMYYREPRSPSLQDRQIIEQIAHLASIAIASTRAQEVLRQQAELLEVTHDGIFVRDRNNVIAFWNRGAEELYGWAREQAIGKVSHQLLHTVFPAPLEEIDEELVRTSRWEGKLVHTRRDGIQITVASRWSLQRNEEGRPAGTLETNNDITERQRAEEALRRSEAHLVAGQRLSHSGSFTWRVSTGEMYWSEETYRIFGYDRATPPSLELALDRVHPEDSALVQQVIEGARQEGQYFDFEHRLLMPDDSVKYVRAVGHAIDTGEPSDLEYVGAVMDITPAKQAEEEIHALTERLLTAQEEERTRIARELHDNLNQEIAAVALSLSRIRPVVMSRDPQAGEQLDRVVQRVSRLSESVRELSHQLHPARLEHFDLATALAANCDEFSSTSGVRVLFQPTGRFDDVPQPVSLCIYRVAQESLQNVAKHAATKEAAVHLERTADRVRLTVSDRGVGFRPSHARASGGLGLVSMRERVRFVRGTLSVESAPEHGTTVKVEIPLMGTTATAGGLGRLPRS